MTEHHAHSVAETAGLPGANAAPETAELPEDEAVTVGADDALTTQDDEHDEVP